MIGRIVDISTDGVHLSVHRGFLQVSKDSEKLGQIAVEDIGAVIVHAHGATFSANLITRLAEQGAALVVCASNHTPIACLWPLDTHHGQGFRMQAQAEASRPLKKRLWQDLIKAKISAQAWALKYRGEPSGDLEAFARKVRSGDADNLEAQAAKRYWTRIMGPDFRRDRTQDGANALMNYGYSVLRAASARAILAAGLHPSLSICHQSRGTALRLADDIMEPFRPYVDVLVCHLINKGHDTVDLTAKTALANLTALDLHGAKGISPLQTCLDRLCSSLAQIYLAERSDLELPGPPMALDILGLMP